MLLGVVLILAGAGIYASAHAVTPVRVDGRVADYKEILINGSYARNELTLADDPHTYVLDQRQFNPALPQRFYQNVRVTIWVDSGSTTVIAITLYDVMGLNPVTHTTGAYDNPAASVVATRAEGMASAGFGLAIMVLVPGWVFVSGRRRKRARAAGQVAAETPVAALTVPRAIPTPAPLAAPTGSAVPAPAPALAPYGASTPPVQPAPWPLTPAHAPAAASSALVEELPTQRTPAVQTSTSGPLSPAAYQTPSVSPMSQPPSVPPPHPTPSIPPAFDRGPAAASVPPDITSGPLGEREASAPAVPPGPPNTSAQPEDDVAELPTQRTPSIPSVPSRPSQPETPDGPVRILPRFGPGAQGAAEPDPPNWGVPWGVAPEPGPPPAPHAPRLVPAGDATRPASPSRPTASDVDELPTEHTPALQPPQDVDELPTQKTPSISPWDDD